MPVPDAVFAEMPDMSDAALRCLLALIRLSWRFDPKENNWVDTEKRLLRADIQETGGLSDEGTRQGLSGLEDKGWVTADRSGRSYQYRLEMNVPTGRYTYLPATLLEEASSFDSTTALRALLAIFRQTWGWTQAETDPQSGDSQAVHRRWTRLSTSDLSAKTGRSETAVKGAIQDLGGEWIGRARPDQGAYLYRILPETFRPDSEEASRREGNQQEDTSSRKRPSPNPPTANEVPPDRQRSGPPTSFRENRERNKQSQKRKKQRKTKESSRSERNKSAVPGDPPPETQSQSPQNPSAGGREGAKSDVDLGDLPPRKQSLARKLINAGVWPKRAKECLRRYSEERIEANFELFRRREPEIDDNGAWLCAAITDGYADLGGQGQNQRQDKAQEGASASSSGPHHKQKVSTEEKRVYLRRSGAKEQHFHRFRCAADASEKQFLYLDPEHGTPTSRGSSRGGPTRVGPG